MDANTGEVRPLMLRLFVEMLEVCFNKHLGISQHKQVVNQDLCL